MKQLLSDKKFIALSISIFIGILGVIGVKTAFDKKVASIDKEGPMIAYVVASEDLPAGTIISSNYVSSRQIPESLKQSNGVLADNYGAIDGFRLNTSLNKGDIIMLDMVDIKKDISALITSGRRAITIPVDDESSISTMLKPGDLIDLIITLQRNDKAVAIPLMQGVKILATGNITDSSSGEESSNYTNITLDVTLEDAKNITLATSMGKITAVLRNPADQIIADTSTFANLLSPPQRIIPSGNPLRAKVMTRVEPIRTPNINIFYGNKND